MNRALLWLCFLVGANAVSTVPAQNFYPDFALVVQLPSYETFMTNLGDSPIRVDGYTITSPSGSLNPSRWKRLGSSGPEITAALGQGATQFLAANPSQKTLSELNPFSSATWQPGQSWSIGFPFNTGDPDLVRDAVFRFSSPDGIVLTGGTVVPPGALFPAAFLVVPEPSSGLLCLSAVSGMLATRFRTHRASEPGMTPPWIIGTREVLSRNWLSPSVLSRRSFMERHAELAEVLVEHCSRHDLQVIDGNLARTVRKALTGSRALLEKNPCSADLLIGQKVQPRERFLEQHMACLDCQLGTLPPPAASAFRRRSSPL